MYVHANQWMTHLIQRVATGCVGGRVEITDGEVLRHISKLDGNWEHSAIY